MRGQASVGLPGRCLIAPEAWGFDSPSSGEVHVLGDDRVNHQGSPVGPLGNPGWPQTNRPTCHTEASAPFRSNVTVQVRP